MTGINYVGYSKMPAAIRKDALSDPGLLQALATSQAGSSTAPVQSWQEGLARALQGAVGGYQQKTIQDQYQQQGDDYTQGLAKALTTGQTGVPAFNAPDDPSKQLVPAIKPGLDALVAGLNSSDSPQLKEMAAQAQIAALTKKTENSGGGVTGSLIDKYMADNPGTTFSQALQAVQTGYRQNMLLNADGTVSAIPGAASTKRDFKYNETMGGNTADQETKPKLARDVAENTAIGDATGKAEGSIEKKAILAPQVESYLKDAEKLLPDATGGGMATAGREVAGFFNHATKGSKIDSQLNVISAALTGGVPRMEGPQSDKDVVMYKQAAGDLANSSLPTETRLSAIKTMREINNRYANGVDNTTPQTPPTPAAPGADTAILQAHPDAQKAADGNYYVNRNGKFFRVQP